MIALAFVSAALPSVLALDEPYGDVVVGPYNVTTTVTVNHGSGGEVPWVKCKWETTNISENGYWMDDYMTGTGDDGTQVDPNLFSTKSIYYWAVVTDEDGVSTLDEIWADVYHPDGSFKYQIQLNHMLSPTDAVTYFDKVALENPTIMTYSSDKPYGYETNYTECRWELTNGVARIYWGMANISYCQPAGCYRVNVSASDMGSSYSADLVNNFWYVPTVGVDYDFTQVDYGNVDEDFEGNCPGNPYFNPGDLMPTVRNTGNVPVNLSIIQDDMNFGMSQVGGVDVWNVFYGARLGDVTHTRIDYEPEEEVTLPDILPLCTEMKLDFYILVDKGPLDTPYSGTMDITASMAGDPHDPFITPSQFT